MNDIAARFKVAPSIVQRSDGQVIQLPPLLYSVAAKADGHHHVDQIAEDISAEIGRGLDGSQVEFLLEDKLRGCRVRLLRNQVRVASPGTPRSAIARDHASAAHGSAGRADLPPVTTPPLPTLPRTPTVTITVTTLSTLPIN